MKDWFLYHILPLPTGGFRYTYVKLNKPPYGPHNPSFNICEQKIFVCKTEKECREKAEKELT